VDIVAFALENAYEANYPLTETPMAVVDLGSDLITVNVFNTGGTLFTRDLSMGGRQITEQIQGLDNLAFKDAETLKLNWDRPVRDLERVGSLLLPVLRTWTEEIKRAFDFLAASDPDSRPEKVILSGGTALLPGLPDFFKQELKLPVELFNPFQKVKVNPEQFDPGYLQQIAPQAATAFGLALRRRDDR
jgi:type IV pilus assembly protein PilM